MRIETTPLAGLLLITPNVYQDSRGYFFESYNRKFFEAEGLNKDFLQDNESLSKKGTLRGLHFQAPPYAQGKLVRVVRGIALDVALDIRKDSSTYGQHYAITLSEENHLMFWIPPGFAHGFLAMEDNTLFSYKCTNVYNKESEGGVLYNDPKLAIDWRIDEQELLLSPKDEKLAPLADLESPF